MGQSMSDKAKYDSELGHQEPAPSRHSRREEAMSAEKPVTVVKTCEAHGATVLYDTFDGVRVRTACHECLDIENERLRAELEKVKRPPCKTCRSTGFGASPLGPDRCSFCDGQEGGNPDLFGELVQNLRAELTSTKSQAEAALRLVNGYRVALAEKEKALRRVAKAVRKMQAHWRLLSPDRRLETYAAMNGWGDAQRALAALKKAGGK